MNEELRTFMGAVEDTELDLVRQLWTPSIVDSVSYDRAFKQACRSGNPDLVRQLIEWKPTIVDSDSYDEAFVYACVNRHLEIVRQLFEWKHTIVDSACFEDGFSCAIDPDVIRLLHRLKPTIVDSDSFDEAFIFACANKFRDIVRLLFELKPTIDLSRFYQYRSLLSSLEIIQRSNLQRESILEGETLDICPICLDNIHGECLVTKCGHKYCAIKNCINQWLEENPTCPVCRQNL